MNKAIWSRILDEFNERMALEAKNPTQPGKPSLLDIYRRSKIQAVQNITSIPLIVYATACTSPKQVHPAMLMIEPGDMTGFQAVTQFISGKKIDVMLHSPGGYPDAAEAIVKMLRRQFDQVRFIVPAFAKSAATMLAMSGNEILMAPDAELGPIDPQMRTVNGGLSPAVAVLELFQKAQKEIAADQTKLAAWMPILSQMGPSLIIDCEHAIKLAGELVETWIKTYMFSGESDASNKAKAIADYLGDHNKFKSHGRVINIKDLQDRGVKVKDLSVMPGKIYDAVMELHSSVDILLSNSPVFKIIENSEAAVIRQQQMVQLPMQMQPLPSKP